MGDSLPVVIIAAAGRARRFRGEQKVLAKVGGVPAICRVAETCEQALGPHQQLIVVGHEGDRVQAVLGDAPHRKYLSQHPLLGTGHVLLTALAQLEEKADREVFFLCGDKPLLSMHSLKRIREDLSATGAAMVFLTGELQGDPTASRQGRVLQGHAGTPDAEVLGIVERASIDALGADETLCFAPRTGPSLRYARDELLALTTVNLSAYVWRERALRRHIGELQIHPEKGEYFVTDLVHLLRARALFVRAVPTCTDAEGLGIDTPEQLIAAEDAWQELQTPPGR